MPPLWLTRRTSKWVGYSRVEATLLSPEVSLGRPCGTGFESSVHTLVAAVLLGLAGLDELGEDAEADPPDREPGEAAERVGGEGGAVVGADTLGQAVLAEEALEDGSGAFDGWGGEPVATEEEATEAILDGQRIAVEAVARAELALEVGAPDGVGRVHGCGWPARMSAARPTPFGWDETVAVQDSVDGADGRRVSIGEAIAEKPLQLGGAPAAAAAELEDGLDDLSRSGVRAGVRPVGTIAEVLGPQLLEAAEPLIARLAADTVAAAELGEGEEAALGVDHEVEPFVHG